jgi:hypothetical protein
MPPRRRPNVPVLCCAAEWLLVVKWYRGLLFVVLQKLVARMSPRQHEVSLKALPLIFIKMTFIEPELTGSIGVEFVEQGITAYQQHFKEQQLLRLRKQAKSLGLQLIPV